MRLSMNSVSTPNVSELHARDGKKIWSLRPRLNVRYLTFLTQVKLNTSKRTASPVRYLKTSIVRCWFKERVMALESNPSLTDLVSVRSEPGI